VATHSVVNVSSAIETNPAAAPNPVTARSVVDVSSAIETDPAAAPNAWRRPNSDDHFYHRRVTFDNSNGPVVHDINVSEVPGQISSFRVFVPAATEQFADDDVNLVSAQPTASCRLPRRREDAVHDRPRPARPAAGLRNKAGNVAVRAPKSCGSTPVVGRLDEDVGLSSLPQRCLSPLDCDPVRRDGIVTVQRGHQRSRTFLDIGSRYSLLCPLG
jgi:hypothetical protein